MLEEKKIQDTRLLMFSPVDEVFTAILYLKVKEVKCSTTRFF